MLTELIAAAVISTSYVPVPAVETAAIEAAVEHAAEHAQEDAIMAAAQAPAQRIETPVGAVWLDLAACESGRGGEPTWDYDGTRYDWGNGLFDGGLQFHPNTWTAFKPDNYPQYAWQATPTQQVDVARDVAAAQGAGAWPSCTAKLGISTGDLVNG